VPEGIYVTLNVRGVLRRTQLAELALQDGASAPEVVPLADLQGSISSVSAEDSRRPCCVALPSASCVRPCGRAVVQHERT
jgi:hypothetical protein